MEARTTAADWIVFFAALAMTTAAVAMAVSLWADDQRDAERWRRIRENAEKRSQGRTG